MGGRSGLSVPGQCKHTQSLGGWECGGSVSRLQPVDRMRGRALVGATED